MSEPLVTILTAPKPFVDPHISIIQRNALRSWQALGPEVDIIVLGNDEGIQANMKELGICNFPDIACNEKGTPIISSMLAIARENSNAPFLAIVNSDIILFNDFLSAIRAVRTEKDKFLLVGQRWDMAVTDEIVTIEDFRQLQDKVKQNAQLHPPAGSDYFIFPRTSYLSIPDFAIGRAGWDNWFIFKSRFERWPVIDATRDVVIVHQDHDYSHLPGGRPHYRLPETTQNVIMAGGEHTIFALFDAQYDLVGGKLLRKKFSWRKIFREIEIFPLSVLHSQLLGKIFFYIFHPRKAYIAFRAWLHGLGGKNG